MTTKYTVNIKGLDRFTATDVISKKVGVGPGSRVGQLYLPKGTIGKNVIVIVKEDTE